MGSNRALPHPKQPAPSAAKAAQFWDAASQGSRAGQRLPSLGKPLPKPGKVFPRGGKRLPRAAVRLPRVGRRPRRASQSWEASSQSWEVIPEEAACQSWEAGSQLGGGFPELGGGFPDPGSVFQIWEAASPRWGAALPRAGKLPPGAWIWLLRSAGSVPKLGGDSSTGDSVNQGLFHTPGGLLPDPPGRGLHGYGAVPYPCGAPRPIGWRSCRPPNAPLRLLSDTIFCGGPSRGSSRCHLNLPRLSTLSSGDLRVWAIVVQSALRAGGHPT